MLRCDGQYSLSKDNIVGRLVSNLKTDIFSIFAQETLDGSVGPRLQNLTYQNLCFIHHQIS